MFFIAQIAIDLASARPWGLGGYQINSVNKATANQCVSLEILSAIHVYT